jgi:regulator of cell morphogenesis and NO signaling
MQATPGTTIGEIVSGDYRAAAVFQKYGIDFCCGGSRTVEDACRAKQIDAAKVLGDVARETATADAAVPQYATWEPSALTAYIISKHHAYVRQALPTITAYTQKLVNVHGANHPELREVDRVFAGVAAEMRSHMMKEEQILFPFIAQLQSAAEQGGPAPFIPFGTVANPIHMMEEEHESAGSAMARIREITGNYQVPDDGCTTYRVGLQELERFELDLHAHVHLENNILFPKALELESELRK